MCFRGTLCASKGEGGYFSIFPVIVSQSIKGLSNMKSLVPKSNLLMRLLTSSSYLDDKPSQNSRQKPKINLKGPPSQKTVHVPLV